MLVLGVLICALSVSAKLQTAAYASQQTQSSFSKYILSKYQDESPEEDVNPGIIVEDFEYRKNGYRTDKVLGKILYTSISDKLGAPPAPITKPPLSKNGLVVLKDLAEAIQPLWYQPIMVLVDDNKEVHRDANMFLRYLMNLKDLKVQFRLMKVNSTGVTPILASSSTNKYHFLNLLEWHEKTNSNETSDLLAPDGLRGTAMFYGILKAVQLLPEHAGIILFTDRHPVDEDLAQIAGAEMISKSIKLFVMWEGPHPTTTNEEKLLREVALITGGDFFIANTERQLSELYTSAYLKNPDSTQAKNIVAFYNKITVAEVHTFPIDSTVTSIHLTVTSPLTAMRLISPGGYSIDVLNSAEVEHFSEGSFSTPETKLGQYEIHLNTRGQVPTPIVGMWRLDVNGGGIHARGCNVTVSVQTHLNVCTYISQTYDDGLNSTRKLPKQKKVLRVLLSGQLKGVDNISLIDTWGLPVIQNISFTRQYKEKEPLMDSDLNSDSYSKKEVDIDLNDIPNGPFYLKIQGEDNDGKAFSRLSYFDSDKISYVMQPVTIEVGAGSQLQLLPNQYGKIFFEVTNNRDQVLHLHFMVQDEQRYLSSMQPMESWLSPKQTVIVTVTTYARTAASANSRDLITFTAYGPERVKKVAAMYVSTTRPIDDYDPILRHRYTSDCTDILLGNCRDGTWVIEVTAQDRESGLLQLTSNPKGLYFPDDYIAGTTERVTGIYGGSCCQPKIQLIAIDILNNRRSYTADAYSATLSAGSISAIVLGILLFIIIVVVIVCLCRRRHRRNTVSVDLPTYRGPDGGSRRY